MIWIILRYTKAIFCGISERLLSILCFSVLHSYIPRSPAEIYSLLIASTQSCIFQSYIASGIFFSPWSKLNDEVMFLFTIRFKINWGTIENVSIYYLSHIYFRRGSFPNRKVQKATIAQFLLKMESGYCETNYSNFTKLESSFKRNE